MAEAKVEKYRQKKSVIEVGRMIRKLHKAKKALTERMLANTQEALKARDMLAQVDQGVAELIQGLPTNKTIELDNQGDER